MNYTLRTVPPGLLGGSTSLFDREVAACLLRLLYHPTYGFHQLTAVVNTALHTSMAPGLSSHVDQVLRLIGLRCGAGLPSAALAAAPAYLGSIALSAPSIVAVVSACMVAGDEVMAHVLDCARYETPFLAFVSARLSDRSTMRALFPAFQSTVSRGKLQHKLTRIARRVSMHQAALHLPPAPLDSARCATNLASSFSKESGAWMFANTRLRFLVCPDDIARFDLLRRLQLLPAVPPRCGACRVVFSDVDPISHSVSCTFRSVNRSAGAVVERAVYAAVAAIEPGAARTPVISCHPLHNRDSGSTKLEGDVRAHHCGRDVILDVTFTSRALVSTPSLVATRQTADAAARAKVQEYGGVVNGVFLPLRSFPSRSTRWARGALIWCVISTRLRPTLDNRGVGIPM